MELNPEEIQNLHAAEVVLRCATAETGWLYALHIVRKVICRSRPSRTQNLITSPSRAWDPSPRHIEGRSAFLETPFALDLAPMISPWTPRKEYYNLFQVIGVRPRQMCPKYVCRRFWEFNACSSSASQRIGGKRYKRRDK
jgi:hypothetical protein